MTNSREVVLGIQQLYSLVQSEIDARLAIDLPAILRPPRIELDPEESGPDAWGRPIFEVFNPLTHAESTEVYRLATLTGPLFNLFQN